MKKRTLGLDLGSNSLGWAVLDDATGDILDKGVVVFPEGMDPSADSTESPAAIRRAARMARRMKFRRKIRKWTLLSLLLENGMCPLEKEELADWKARGRYPTGNAAFIGWLKATNVKNPYCDRVAAADGPVPPEVLGRALYHLAQRRGFKSSRKDETDGEDGETSSAREKELGAVKAGIKALDDEIRASGCKTLGQYFKKILDEDFAKPAKRRIRKRYTGRVEHYEKEFAAIMDAQAGAVSPELRAKLHDAIFDQRPLRSQAHLVGPCPLEPKSPRAQIAHPAFEEFRMLSFVNNLTLEDADGEWRDPAGAPLYPLTPDDRAKIRKAFMKAAPTFKFGDIAKLFKKDPRFKSGMRFHYYRNDETLSSCSIWHRLEGIFGADGGDDPFRFQAEFDALTFFDDRDKLRGWLAKHHPELDEASAAAFLKIHPREGNVQYSLKAIRKILPWLRKGHQLSDARFFAKLPEVVPGFDANEDRIVRDLLDIEAAARREKANRAKENVRATEKPPVPLADRWRDYLAKTWGVDEAGWKRLYLRGEDPYAPQTETVRNGKKIPLARPRLPRVELGMIRNPLVQRSMTTLRRLVNYLGDHGKIAPSTTIRVELARDVNDFATRKGWQNWQKKRQADREEAREAIANLHLAPTEDAVDRYVLWKEQDGKCLYTARSISLRELLSGNAFDVEHTIPRSLSGDDSLANKTICEATYNRQTKMGRPPRECPNWDDINTRLNPWREKLETLEKAVKAKTAAARKATDPKAKSAARAKAVELRFERDYWRDKLRRFDATREQLEFGTGDLTGFKKRQLVDTGIMTRHAVDLLKCLYPRTFTVNGAATAFARKAWGIQTDEAKSRDEHTHHATDAMVIAALSPARFSAICSALKDDGKSSRRPCDVCPPPFKDFAEKVRRATDEILVKHVLRQTTLRQSSKRNVLARAHAPKDNPDGKKIKAVLSRGDTVRGRLHKDTFYGCIQTPGEGGKAFVIRKSLIGKVSDAKSLLPSIVDSAIRGIVQRAIAHAEAENRTDFAPGDILMPSGVPINKVRIFAPTNASPGRLRDHAIPSRKDYKMPFYVSAAEGSNFRLALFLREGRFSVEPDNSLAWAQNHKKPGYLPMHEREGFVGYIMPGTMALVHASGNPGELRTLSQTELRKRLYKVVKFESGGRITLRFHSEARASTVLAQALKAEGKHASGSSTISLDNPHELLYLSPGTYRNQVVFEGIHFQMMLDGSIRFLVPS